MIWHHKQSDRHSTFSVMHSYLKLFFQEMTDVFRVASHAYDREEKAWVMTPVLFFNVYCNLQQNFLCLTPQLFPGRQTCFNNSQMTKRRV